MDEDNPQKVAAMSATLDKYHLMAGRIASQYAALEHSIDQAIWILSGVKPAVGACLTSQLGSTRARIRTLTALLNLREGSDEFVKRIKRLNEKLFDITEMRNRTVHDTWGIDSEDLSVSQIRITIDRQDNVKIDYVNFSMEEMNKNLSSVSKKMQEFVQLYHDICTWLASSTDNKWKSDLPSVSLGRLDDRDPLT